MMLERIAAGDARDLMPVVRSAVDDERLIMIDGDQDDAAVVASRALLLRLLAGFTFHVDVIPEPDGGFTLAVRELNVAEDGDTLLQARQNLLDGVRSYVRHYFDTQELYRQIPEMR